MKWFVPHMLACLTPMDHLKTARWTFLLVRLPDSSSKFVSPVHIGIHFSAQWTIQKQVNFLWLLSSWLPILQWFHFNLGEIPAKCTGHFALLNCKFSYYSLATGLWSRFRPSFKLFPNLKCPRALNWFESLEVDDYGIAVYGWGKTLDCNFIINRILTRSKRILESMLEPVIWSACISSSECDVFVPKVIILSSPEDWFKDIWASLWCSKLYAGLHWASSTSFKHAICSQVVNCCIVCVCLQVAVYSLLQTVEGDCSMWWRAGQNHSCVVPHR